jgi:hypothetical protein
LAAQQKALKHVDEILGELGSERTDWPNIISALNDKIPAGVWITELSPQFDVPLGPDNRPKSADAPNDKIVVLMLNGLYHSNAKTMQVDSARLGEFVNALATLPYFDIDPAKMSETLISFTTPDTDPNSFAQRFSIRLKLKKPIIVKPTPAPVTP